MSLNRIIVVMVVLVTAIFLAASGSFAAKGGNGNGNGGGKPPPEPTDCEDPFPVFLYEVKGTRKRPAELRLSSSNGCRTELVATSTHLEWSAFHMTSDGSEGVIVWSEDPESNFQSIVWRRDFTVDEFGDLELEQPVTILPLVGEEVPPEGQNLGYSNLDIWGDATHGLLFLLTKRNYCCGSGSDSGGIEETLIYDLNSLPNVNASPGVREIYYENYVDWGGYPDWQDAEEPDCNDSSSVSFPRFVPSCYRPQDVRFNPSGTRIYFQSTLFLRDGRREYAGMRININWSGSSNPADWIVTGPEMVYVNGPRNALPRPQSDPLMPPTEDSHEIVMLDDQFLDADQCAAEYAAHSGANLDPQRTIWLECLVYSLFTNSDARSRAWESSDSYLFRRSAKRRDDIYRFYVSGSLEGREEKLIESGESPDSGF